MRERLIKVITSSYREGVFFLFSLCVLFLTFISFINTTMIAPYHFGRYFFLPEHPGFLLLAVFLFIVLLVFLRKLPIVTRFTVRVEEDDAFFLRVRRGILLITGIVAVIWVLSSQLIPFPADDQQAILDGASQLRSGENSLFQPGAYYYRYHNNIGLMLLCYYGSFLFGGQNYVAFQMFNIIALLLLLRELSELCAVFQFGRTVQLTVVLEGLLFFPLILYCSFVYGTMPGLAITLLACRLECRFLQKGRHKDAFFCAACCFLAIIIKSNYQIFLIGMIIVAIIEAIQLQKIKLLMLPCIMVLIIIFVPTLLQVVCEHLAACTLNQPQSAWTWIAMGLSEPPMAPPGYADNALSWRLYKDSGFNTEQNAILAKEICSERLVFFLKDRTDAFRFFSQKLTYEWSEPSFQAFWSIIGLESHLELAPWVKFMISWNGQDWACKYLNILQALHLVGVCLYIVLFQRERENTQLICMLLPLIFIGGFVFHIFWEAGPRYTLIFFILLFPYAHAGYERLTSILISCFLVDNTERRTIRNKLRLLMPYFCVLMLGILLLSVVYRGPKKEMLSSEGEAYSEYLANNPTPYSH